MNLHLHIFHNSIRTDSARAFCSCNFSTLCSILRLNMINWIKVRWKLVLLWFHKNFFFVFPWYIITRNKILKKFGAFFILLCKCSRTFSFLFLQVGTSIIGIPQFFYIEYLGFFWAPILFRKNDYAKKLFKNYAKI